MLKLLNLVIQDLCNNYVTNIIFIIGTDCGYFFYLQIYEWWKCCQIVYLHDNSENDALSLSDCMDFTNYYYKVNQM